MYPGPPNKGAVDFEGMPEALSLEKPNHWKTLGCADTRETVEAGPYKGPSSVILVLYTTQPLSHPSLRFDARQKLTLALSLNKVDASIIVGTVACLLHDQCPLRKSIVNLA